MHIFLTDKKPEDTYTFHVNLVRSKSCSHLSKFPLNTSQTVPNRARRLIRNAAICSVDRGPYTVPTYYIRLATDAEKIIDSHR